MTDFRYHVVATVAVLLALAVGVVVGSAALNGSKVGDLNRHVQSLGAENHELTTQLRSLRSRIEADASFATSVEPQVVAGKLAGARVVVVTAPHAPTAIAENLMQDLRSAGASVVSQVQLTDSYIDPGQTALLGDLADRLTPVDVVPPTGSPEQRAAGLLSDALVGTASATDATTIVQGFAAAGVLTVTGTPASGSLSLFVTGPSHPAPTPVVSLIDQLAGHGGVVVAGAGSAAKDSALFAVRTDQTANASTVDDADTPVGRIAVIFALGAARSGGTRGDYGTGLGASAPLPSNAP